MFRQVKSAIFWTLVYKFRKRLTLVVLLLSTVLLSQWIYADIIEYLKLTEKTQYLDYILPIKWFVILLNIGVSAYILLTLFKQSNTVSKEVEEKPEKQKIYKETKQKSNSKFSDREKKFLNKKLRSEAEVLMDR